MKTLKQIISGTLIAGALAFGFGCESDDVNPDPVDPAPEVIVPNYDNVIVSAEDPASYTGAGQGMPRGQAESRSTWLMHNRSAASYNVNLEPNSAYDLAVGFSNDGPTDRVSISFNNKSVGNFRTTSTGSWGNGWLALRAHWWMDNV